jgi:hypothetical protein
MNHELELKLSKNIADMREIAKKQHTIGLKIMIFGKIADMERQRKENRLSFHSLSQCTD